MNLQKGLLCVLAVTAALAKAGCDLGEESRQVWINPDELSMENGTFHAEGTVLGDPGTNSNVVYQNVSLVFYSGDKRVIERVPIGNVSTTDTAETAPTFDVTLSTRPTYIVLESPDFWTSEPHLNVKGRHYRSDLEGDSWEVYVIKEGKKFPENETGTT